MKISYVWAWSRMESKPQARQWCFLSLKFFGTDRPHGHCCDVPRAFTFTSHRPALSALYDSFRMKPDHAASCTDLASVPPRQALDVQILHGDDTVVIHKFTRQLVLEIVALLEHMAIEFGNDAAGTFPAARPLRASGNVALLAPKFFLGCAEPSRIVYHFGIAGYREGFQANIYANGIVVLRQRFAIQDRGKEGLPLAVFILESE